MTVIDAAVRRTVIFVFVIAFVAAGSLAQGDPDPNSPTPILISQDDSTRALTTSPDSVKQRRQAPLSTSAYGPGSKAQIFVTNISLLGGEGANAFRVYAEDANGRLYRYPVLDVEPTKADPDVYVVTILVKDEIGYWQPEFGDVYLRLTWRGLSSNRVKFGFGSTGGDLKDDPAVQPMPLSLAVKIRSNGEPVIDEYVGYRWSGDRMRFLQQATFGPTTEADQRLRRIGLRTWLAEQLDAPYPSFDNPYPEIPLKNIDAQNVTNGCGMFLPTTNLTYRLCVRDHYTMYPVQKWFLKEALYGTPQLRHRAAWALSQVWVISGVDTQQSSWMMAYYKVLAQHAFGNYRALMRDMTLNPGMGNYLDMARSTRTNPNENYPREILQLFSIGLFMLNQDGTLMLDGQGNPIPTYDQATVDNFTKVFTGWTFCNQTCPNSQPGIVNYKDPMILIQNNHDVTAKTLLSYPGAVNQNIPPNLNGNTELELALDNIFYHPNVGPFVSKLMIQHMVTSDPTPAYVGRVAAVFNNNGQGVRGDMKSVIRAILLDPEARGDLKTDPNFGKLREPVQFVTNILRPMNVKSADLSTQSDGVITALTNPIGQNPFNSPTVFNYFSPDYYIPGTTLLGPEFALMTTGTSIGRANVVNGITYNQINVTDNTPQGTRLDLADLQALSTADPTGNLLLDELNYRLLHGRMSAAMRSAILPAVTALPTTDPLGRARAALYLVATSSQFQVQR
ncbi:MAG: DUF1800 domain-containing protein [Pyrinomonadaceae bacterium]|nr:DUF1800 domain-containing protein [Pyrinomonadaceae bacterium]